MKPRSIRSAVLAVVAVTIGAVVVATSGGPAGAATVSQTLSCSPGGNQNVSLITTAPATVTAGGTFTVVLAPGSSGKADGAEVKNMVSTFQAPAGSEIVAGSATATGGSGSLGSISTSISGQTVSIKTTGPVPNGQTFTPPTLSFQLRATGAAGTNLRVTFRQSNAYTLTVAGSINVNCNANSPATLTSTVIQAPTTTTTSTSSTTTSTTAPTSTTTTKPGTVTTQTWSPTGPCGTVGTVTAPAGTTSVKITAVGGSGGRSGSQSGGPTAAGGTGGQAVATFPATGGQTYSAVVGCKGTDGSGASNSANPAGFAPGGGTGRGSIISGTTGASAGSGGGASAACLGTLCTSSAEAASPLVIAGGGGGGGVSNCAGTASGAGGNGGSGSSTTGSSGIGPSGANGGTASSKGGVGGVNSAGGPAYGGSNADSTGGGGVSVVGGGGGGGRVGGGQGANTSLGCKGAGGGGGGSSWVRVTGTGTSFTTSASPKVVLVFTYVTSGSTTTTTTTTGPCNVDKAPFATVQALVNQQYQDFTGKAPTAAQSNQWVPAITTCSTTADAFIVGLLPSDLTVNDDARLVRLYLAYFNRPPDPDGYAYWQRQLDAGRGLINAARKFADSPEFKRTYGTLSNGAFIDLVYRNVLGRTSDPSGRAFWLTRLDNKTKNRGDVMINFSESSENVRSKTSHVQVFRLHRSMLQRFPSSTAYFGLLDPILDGGKSLADAARAIRLSPAYDARV
jgi:hypothetical protein